MPPQKRRRLRKTNNLDTSSTTNVVPSHPSTSSQELTPDQPVTTNQPLPRKAWCILPPEIRRIVCEFLLCDPDVNACGCSVTFCEFGCAQPCVKDCPARQNYYGRETPILVNPYVDFMLANKSLYEDIKSVPQVPLKVTFHGYWCAWTRIEASTPLFLKRLSQVRVPRKVVIEQSKLRVALQLVDANRELDADCIGGLLEMYHKVSMQQDSRTQTMNHDLVVEWDIIDKAAMCVIRGRSCANWSLLTMRRSLTSVRWIEAAW